MYTSIAKRRCHLLDSQEGTWRVVHTPMPRSRIRMSVVHAEVRNARCECLRAPRRSIVKHDTEQRAVDFERQLAVVFDEAELLELVEKEVHPRSRGTDHFSERFLRHARNDARRLVL